jgi:hypothetical protein
MFGSIKLSGLSHSSSATSCIHTLLSDDGNDFLSSKARFKPVKYTVYYTMELICGADNTAFWIFFKFIFLLWRRWPPDMKSSCEHIK